jgi:hypothetical protein
MYKMKKENSIPPNLIDKITTISLEETAKNLFTVMDMEKL